MEPNGLPDSNGSGHPSDDSQRHQQLPGSSAGSPKFNIVSFGKDFFTIRRGKRSATQEDQIIPNIGQRSNPDLFKSSHVHQPINPPRPDNKSKGFKKFLSMLKKSEPLSQSLDQPNHFVRGGVRSTAGPRLMSGERKRIEINLPFSRMDRVLLAQWFSSIGLGMYSEQCKRLVKSGEQLLSLTEAEVEKGLGIKNKLHRKKLKLALAFANNDCDPLTKAAHKLDYLWVARWLDDIGLPQYKDNFINARVDGAVLHRLTIQDLVHLNVNSKIHYCSIKRGIQVLRDQNFQPNCLKRRATPEEANLKQCEPSSIALWTSHRVMEWLRCIDLSEYTSSLRGSGVHGAFIIHEPAFDVDLLASLLGIPSSRTLLRRYINTHFTNLLGPELVQEKREYQEKNPPLLSTSKILSKGSKFSLIRRKIKSEFNLDDLVCPLTVKVEPKECPVHGSVDADVHATFSTVNGESNV